MSRLRARLPRGPFLFALLLLVPALGCSTYVRRLVTLRQIDVEDYRSLPSRVIRASARPLALPSAADPSWITRMPLAVQDRQLTSEAELDAFMEGKGTTALVVLHRGRLVDERYYQGYGRESLFKSFSISKSVLSALVGIAQAEGMLRVTDPLGKYVDLRNNPRLAKVTLEQLADNVSGFAYRREKTESGFVARAVDLARFGLLYLQGGVANGQQLVPADWVRESITPPPAGAPNRFEDGFHRKLWWGASKPGRVRNDFYANGHFGQRIYVCPDKELVLVRLGNDSAGVNWTALLGRIADAWPAAAASNDSTAATTSLVELQGRSCKLGCVITRMRGRV